MAASTSSAISLPSNSPPSKPRLYKLKITLYKIWRRVVVPEDFSLLELHVVIQLLFGWENYHLHHFMSMSQKGKLHERMSFGLHFNTRIEYMLLEEEEDSFSGGMDVKDERLFKICDVFSEDNPFLEYEYDFGACWEHVIKFEGVIDEKKGQDYPQCIGGKGPNRAEDNQDLDSDGEIRPEYQDKQFMKDETQLALKKHFEGRCPLKDDKRAVPRCSPCDLFDSSFGTCPGATCTGKCCIVCLKASDVQGSASSTNDDDGPQTKRNRLE